MCIPYMSFFEKFCKNNQDRFLKTSLLLIKIKDIFIVLNSAIEKHRFLFRKGQRIPESRQF